MAYFRENEPEETKRQQIVNVSGEDTGNDEDTYIDSDYDDGFDDLSEEQDEDLSEDEQKQIRTQRFRVASGAANIAAVIGGTLLILILLAFLMKMIGFVLNDADRNFTLFQTRF